LFQPCETVECDRERDRVSVRDHFRLVVSFMIEIGIHDLDRYRDFFYKGFPPFWFHNSVLFVITLILLVFTGKIPLIIMVTSFPERQYLDNVRFPSHDQ
jgi:hypothetical protein